MNQPRLHAPPPYPYNAFINKNAIGVNTNQTQALVRDMLTSLETGREAAALAMAKKFDNWSRPTFVLTDKEIEATVASLSQATREDIQFQQARVKDFTLAQIKSIKEFRGELYPGVETGQRVIPVNCAGCYVPGGRFSHVASATMTIVTAKTCGVKTVLSHCIHCHYIATTSTHTHYYDNCVCNFN